MADLHAVGNLIMSASEWNMTIIHLDSAYLQETINNVVYWKYIVTNANRTMQRILLYEVQGTESISIATRRLAQDIASKGAKN